MGSWHDAGGVLVAVCQLFIGAQLQLLYIAVSATKHLCFTSRLGSIVSKWVIIVSGGGDMSMDDALALFQRFDVNGNGTLGFDELREFLALQKIHEGKTTNNHTLYSCVDHLAGNIPDGCHSIFLQLRLLLIIGVPAADVPRLFGVIDTNSDGSFGTGIV